MNQLVADIELHSNLIDDYLYLQDAPANPGPPGSFVAVRQTGADRSDLLTVDSDGSLLHFAPDRTSASGWRVTKVDVSVPAGVTTGLFGTVSFYNGGVLNAICLFTAPQSIPASPDAYTASWMMRTAAGAWQKAQITDAAQSMLSLCTQLDHYTDTAGNVYVYGVVPPMLGQLSASPGYLAPHTATFFVLYYDVSHATWDVAYQAEAGTLNAEAPVTFQILSAGSAAPMILWIDSQTLQWQQASLSPSQDGVQWIGNRNTLSFGSIVIDGVKQVIRFPGDAFVDIVLILDNSQTLWLAQFLSGNNFPILIQLTGIENAPSSAASAMLTSTGGTGPNTPLFVVEAGTRNLWLGRQYGGDVTNWVNLGNQVQAIAVPEIVSAGFELFLVDLKNRVFHMSQNSGDTVWVTTKVAAPVPSSGTPQKVSCIEMHAAAVDSHGSPVPNAVFTVASDQWVNLVVEGLSYWTGPPSSAVFAADAVGHATVQFLASGLAMPKLTFSAASPGAASSSGTAQRWCQGDVIEVKENETAIPVSGSSVASRLAGKDPLCPISEQTLESAKLLDPNFNGKSDAVNNITQIGKWMMAQNAPSAPGATPLETRHWRFEFGSGKKTCKEVAGPALVQRPPGSIFSDIFGDVTNWAKHAAGEVTHIAISVGTSFEIAFNDAVSFTVKTVREAGEALEVVFVHIAQDVEDAVTIIKEIVEFLMLLFEWKDILNTSAVLGKIVTSLLDALASSASALQTVLNEEFDNLTAKVKSVLGTVGNNPAFTKSFNQFANEQSSTALTGANVLNNPRGTNAFHHHLPQCLYVYSRAKHISFSRAPGSIDISGITDAIAKAWSKEEVIPLEQQFLAYVGGNHGGLTQLLDFGIDEMVRVLQDLITLALAGAQLVTGAILELIPAMVAAFNAMFVNDIDLPVISFILKPFGIELSLLELFCLICAVPVTILYKALNDGDAPFGADDANNLSLPWPNPNEVRSNTPARASAIGDFSIYQKLGMCGVAMDLLNAFIAPGCDALAFDNASGPLVTLLTWTSNLAAFVTAGLEAPWSVWVARRMTNSADIMTTVLWGLVTIPAIYDTLFAFATDGLARFLAVAGPILDGTWGVLSLGVGIATGVVQVVEDSKHYKGWDTANSIVPQLARPFRFLILDQDNPTAPISMGALISVDILVSGAAAFTQLAATAEG